MAIVVVNEQDGALSAAGDLELIRRADPHRRPGGEHAFSLEAGWRWREDGLELFADRLGMLPVFYRREPRRLVVGDSLEAVCRACGSCEPCDGALAVFLRLGYFLGDDTPFDGVRVLPPGTHVRLASGAFPTSLEAAPEPVPRANVSRREAIETYVALFREAMAARANGSAALPLSGGRDSRHVLFDLLRSGGGPSFAVTSGDPRYANDRRVAEALCRRHGVRLHVAATEQHPLHAEEEKNRRTSFLTDEHWWWMAIGAELRRHGGSVFFDGIGGDVLSNGLFFDPALHDAFARRDAAAVAERLLGNLRPVRLLGRDLARRWSTDAAAERIAREARRHVDAANPVKSFFFWNRTRREIALAPLVLGEGLQAVTPYLAPELLRFLMSLPAGERGERGFHDAVIEEAYPEHRRIPYAGRSRLPRVAPVDRLPYAALCVRAARTGRFSTPFLVTRGTRFLLTGRQSDVLWLRQVAYLTGLHHLADSEARPGSSPVGRRVRETRRMLRRS